MRDTDDHYRVLQVDPSADSETIEAAYRAQAKKYHPDRNPSPDATQETQRLNRARDVLFTRTPPAVQSTDGALDRAEGARRRVARRKPCPDGVFRWGFVSASMTTA